VIAPELLPDYEPQREPRPRHARPELRRADRARHAARRRTRRTRRAMHRPAIAMILLAFAVLVPLLIYVTLTANLTSLNFALSRAEHERTALSTETQRLDDKIAGLQSPERLAALAASLKLHDPHVYAVVRLPDPKQPQPRPTGIALLGAWFTGAR
jgi:cell division protein FtsL